MKWEHGIKAWQQGWIGLCLGLSLCMTFAVHAQVDTGWQNTSTPLKPLPVVQSAQRQRDFVFLDRPVRATPHRIEVLVFFWYGSPWAKQIEPHLRQWQESGQMPARVRVQWVPLILDFNDPNWAVGARVFYALQKLGKEHSLRHRLMIAKQSGVVQFSNPLSITRWMEEQGIPKASFEAAINDPLVIAQVSRLPNIQRMYDVKSSPTFVLMGEMKVESNEKRSPEKATAIMMFMATQLNRGVESREIK